MNGTLGVVGSALSALDILGIFHSSASASAQANGSAQAQSVVDRLSTLINFLQVLKAFNVQLPSFNSAQVSAALELMTLLGMPVPADIAAALATQVSGAGAQVSASAAESA